jgi:hypothetical protein
MNTQDSTTKSSPGSANFFAESSSSNLRIVVFTILFMSDLTVWVVVFFKGWTFLSLPNLVFLLLALFFLCVLAKSGFQAHRLIRTLVQGGRTESIEERSSLEGLIRMNTNTVLNGLLFIFAMAGCFLIVLGELVFSR